MSEPRADVHVEELVVRGFGADGRLVADALGAQLQHVLSDPAVVEALRSADGVERIDGGTVRLGTEGSGSLGRAAAAAVGRSVRGGG